HPFRRYLYRSRYAEHIRQFLQHFPVEQMQFVLLDELLKDPEAVCRRLCAFLGIEFKDSYAANWTGARNVRSHAPRWPALQRLLRSEGARDSLPARALRRLNVRLGPPIPPVDPADRAQLRAQLAPSVADLAALTGLPVLERWGYGGGAA
ncbi:MAG TPA: sulfotransferase domain-containing protein, partial [Solimonas sp.]|nr:sulfotransferase domain-containing protein [Solimonas sp.]